MIEIVYFYSKLPLLIISLLLSGGFLWFFFKKNGEISHVKINEENLRKYVGKTSFFYNYKNVDKINKGLQKNLRFLYSTWFYVCICTGIISLLSILGALQIDRLEKVNNWGNFNTTELSPIDYLEKVITWGNLDTSKFSIIAAVEKENSDYERQKFITTTDDSSKFPLLIKYKSAWIDFRYPIDDTLTVDFVKFDTTKAKLLRIEKEIHSFNLDSLKKLVENSTDLTIKNFDIKDSGSVYWISFKDSENDLKILLDSLQIDSIGLQINSLDLQIDALKKRAKVFDRWFTNRCKTKDNIIVYCVYPLKITLKGKRHQNIELKCIIETKLNDKGLKYRANIDKKGYIIKEDTNEYVHKIVRSDTEDTIKYQKFFNKCDLDSAKIDTLKKEIIGKVQKERGKEIEGQKVKIKLIKTKDWYSTLTDILSLLANLFLLLFFGFLNTKTDLFSKNENKFDVFGLYRIFVIGIFFIILLILLLDAFFPWYSNYSPIFSSSFLFVIHLIIALTSIIAIFGCWGSLNNSYTSFPDFFKFWMILYAMTNFFELNTNYIDENFNKVADLFFYVVAIIAKISIIRILLYWAPKHKRILWFFFTAVNNFRTENDYEDFVKIFDIHKLERENAELKRKSDDFDKTLLKLKQENVELKHDSDDLPLDLRILKEIIKRNSV
jgi:hypothetical protein